MMTFTDMITFCRTHADTDDTDLPDASLKVYGRMAYTDILSRRHSWPHLEVEYTFSSVANVNTYNPSIFSTADMDSIYAVLDTATGERLQYVTRSDADIVFGGVASVTGRPVAWTMVGATVQLYPKPTAVRNYTVRGSRKQADWPSTAGSSPDLPDVFHEAIAWYMLSNYYLAQEDTQLSGVYLNEFEQIVGKHVSGETKKRNAPRPRVVGGNLRPWRVGTKIRWGA